MNRVLLFAALLGVSAGSTTGLLGTASQRGAAPAPGQDWISLFDGKSLSGWRASENPGTWSVRDGAIVTQGPRSHLFYVGEVASHNFKNFEFEADVMTTPGSNSGIYVHTQFQDVGFPAAGYELQVINTNPPLPPNNPNAYVEHKMTGSIYAIRNTWRAPAPDGVWFRYRIRVSGKTIQTYINNELICEYTEPVNPFRPADKKGRVLGSGTFALQGHDPNSVVHYRALRVRLLPEDAPSLGEPLADRELDEIITQLSNDNFALLDLGIRPTSTAEANTAALDARRYGMTLFGALPIDALNRLDQSLFVLTDHHRAATPEVLQQAKAAGAKIAFSSGGAPSLDETRLKARLQAIRAAKLAATDLWIPGKF
jgi:hypothetical protein